MALQLILGSSGSGKSYELYHEIIRRSKEKEDRNYLVIVPEQFTMQTQKDLVSFHPDKGVLNIDILSFMRLAYRVFDEVGGNDKPILDDMGKSMVVRKVVERKKKELMLFQNNIHKSGFINELKSMISELCQYGVKSEQLEEMITISKEKSMLQGKLQDISTIYTGFKEYLREKYITPEEILDILCQVIAKSELVKNCEICFDGFTGFSPSQYRLIEELMKYAKKVWITVTIDKREDFSKEGEEFHLFYLSKKTILKLYEIADKTHTKIEEPFFVEGKIPYRFLESKPLASLEHNLFRYPWKAYKEKQSDIHIYAAADAFEEVAYTIQEVKRLIREENYRYNEIAIVTGDIEVYGTIAAESYTKAKIPVFLDYKKDVLSNPFVEMIRSLIDMFCKDFTYETVFRYLRSGMIAISKEELDILENYVIASGVRGWKRWNREWKRTWRGAWSEERNGDVLSKVNEIRERVLEHLKTVQKSLGKKKETVLFYTKAIYYYILEENIWDKLVDYQNHFLEKNELLAAKEYAQVYKHIMDLFDRFVELLGEEEVTIKEYKDLLETGFAEVKIGLIPPSIDQVVIGDIQRTRLKDIRALFFIGVNDGIIPKIGGGGGIISDIEREILAEHHFELAPTKRQSAYTEQFYLYLNLTKPKNKLYLTYSKVDGEGKALRASYLIGKLIQLFPSLEIAQEQKEKKEIEDILGSDNGTMYIIKGLRDYKEEKMQEEWKELYRFYWKKEEFQVIIKNMVEGSCYQGGEHGISKAVAHVLYGNELNNSVTRIELYAACAFAHFLSYGLMLKERQEFRLNMPDIGNLFHYAIELFSKKLEKSTYNWHTITEEIRKQFVKISVEEAIEKYDSQIFHSSKRNEYMIKRIERMTERTIWALCEQIKRGQMEPKAYEISFSYLDNLESIQLPLSETQSMKLKGRIDRLDTYEEEEALYLRVIDYKSGEKSFDFIDLYYGLQLQLIIYLTAAMEMEERNNPKKEIIPAGIFYYHIDDPIIDKIEDEEDAKEALLKELKMKGLANSAERPLTIMDKKLANEKGEIKPSEKSDIIPVEISKEGVPTKRSFAADTKSLLELSSFVKKKITDYGKEILEGNTKINPYNRKDKSACDFCSYKGICDFDKKILENRYRNLKDLSRDDIWRKIHEQCEMDKGPTESN